MKPATPFMSYLRSLGDEEAMRVLGAPRRTVQSWRRGERLPRPAQARAIVQRAPVTMADIYGEERRS